MKVVSQEQLYLTCGKTNTALSYNQESECRQKVLKILWSIHAYSSMLQLKLKFQHFILEKHYNPK